MKDIHVGTSGYSYSDWVGSFYPQGLKSDQWLAYYASKLDTVELNVTFYRTPKQSMFSNWYQLTPKYFHFVIKGSRFITHLRRLNDVDNSLKFFLGAAQSLKEKLKIILWQLPPKFAFDPTLLSSFLDSIAHAQVGQVRHAFEFRDISWLDEETYKILRDHQAALVFSDHPFKITAPATADFLYIRRHGPGGQYHVAYSNRNLKKDASLIRRYGLLTYEFFNNDVEAVGAKNALELKSLLNLG